MDIFWAIEGKPKGHMFLKAFSRNRQAMKNDLTKLQQLFN